MADENILKEFVAGETLKANDTNSNNHYLDNKITNLGNKITSVESSITSQIKTIFNNLYPVGSIYMTSNNTCPMTSIITGSTWELVATGRALWCGNGSNGNSTITAGLPNITGDFRTGQNISSDLGSYASGSGAFARSSSSFGNSSLIQRTDGSYGAYSMTFDASRSNSIYGNSNTVQPPAYVVNVYRRTA